MKAERSTGGRRVIRRYSAEDRARLVEEHSQSGQTKKDFCAQQGIAIQTFYGWAKRRELQRGPRFARVEVAAPIQVTAP